MSIIDKRIVIRHNVGMSTMQGELKINLSEDLIGLLRTKAGRLGVSITQLVKQLISREVKDEEYPTYIASASTIKAAKGALKEHDKAIRIDDIHKYFKNL